MQLIRSVLLIFTCLIISYSFASDNPEAIKVYKESKMVFLGKIIGMQEVDKDFQTNDVSCFKKKYIIEFEIEKIYKGKRHEKLLIYDTVDVEFPDYYIINREYLVFINKNRKNTVATKFGVIRSRRLGDDQTISEINLIAAYVNRKWFRREKNPQPLLKFISGGCNC